MGAILPHSMERLRVSGKNDLLGMTVAEIRKMLVDAGPPPREILKALEQDARSGVRQLAEAFKKRSQKHLQEDRRLEALLQFEKELWMQGFRMIAGVDEAGMAPLAGPVVAAAVILPHGYKLEGLNDSKKIPDRNKREAMASRIKHASVAWAVGRAEAEEIDSVNIYRAGLLAMSRAVKGLRVRPDYLLVDARSVPNCPCPQKGIIHGDALSASIAAASIIAKTTRDRHLIELDAMYPGYGFASHKGYPTPEHLAALKKLGPLPIHRKSFAPVRECLEEGWRQEELFPEQK